MNHMQKNSDRITFKKQTDNQFSQDTHTKGKRMFALICIFFFILSLIGGVGLCFLYHMYKTLPSPKELANIQPSLVSRVLAADSSLVHEFSIERRFWMPLERIPADLQNAVIAIEDQRFYKHWGISIQRIVGAIVADLLVGEYAQGASTLTQQLAKNHFLTARQSLIRKVREAMTAVQIELYYTKNEILELYLNMVYLGAGVYGVEAASQRYFSKSVSELTINECTVLAGCIQLPERYRPDKMENRQRIIDRRNTVLRAMKKMKFISNEMAQSTISDTIPNNPQFRVSKKAPYFVEMVRQYMEQKYGEDKLYNGGLTIHTTLDPFAQDSTDKAVTCFLDSLQMGANRMFLDSSKAHEALNLTIAQYMVNFDSLYNLHKQEYDTLPDSIKLRIVQASVFAIDVKTGAIKVCTGGRDYNESKFNRALQARRQPGSSFKPFVYTVAIENGFTPATVIMDQPITLETPEGLWRPQNYEKKFYGPVSLRNALNRSINLVAIQVLQEVGVYNVIDYARKAGLKHTLNPVPALAIGACEATNYEMTLAYSVYANHGAQATPYCIEKIYDRNGRLLESHTPESKKILSASTAYIMASLLSTVVRAGTGASSIRRGFTRLAGGKTGTTDDYSDAWFIGFTPQIACGVWVGVDERRSMGHGVTGSRGALPIWTEAMKALHRELPVAEGFGRPETIRSERICKETFKVATQYCPETINEIFAESDTLDTCDEHVLNRGRSTKNIRQRLGSDKKSGTTSSKKKSPLIF